MTTETSPPPETIFNLIFYAVFFVLLLFFRGRKEKKKKSADPAAMGAKVDPAVSSGCCDAPSATLPDSCAFAGTLPLSAGR